MANLIKFSKMQGAGNDYIYINTMLYPIAQPEQLSMRWSQPHTGIGSDGLVLIGASDIADFSMRIYNADGSEAKMCGNASRCIGKYVYENGLTTKRTITLETRSGVKTLRLNIEDEKVSEITVDMGSPVVGPVAIDIEVAGETYKGTVVSMGNPHLVIFVDDLDKIDLPNVGPLLETHPLFPDRTNVEFAQVRTPGEVRMRVWERGSGITQACGTGACATAVAGIVNGKTERETTIIMDGGALRIEWPTDHGPVRMTGNATHVFDGFIEA